MRAVTQKGKQGKMPKILFITCIIVICIYVLYQRGHIPEIAMLSEGEGATLEFVRDIVALDVAKNQEFIVNQDQLIWITEDGVKALSLEGEEIWADTHTIKKIAVAQRTPYFAISEKGGKVISIFDTHGKKADLKFANPVMYFSMNKRGDIVVIESTQDGHVISAFDQSGSSLGVKWVTYVEDVGHPTVAEISPDGKVILISHINTDDAQIVSNIIAIEIGSGGLSKVDNILYGETYKNTIISEIEFIDGNTWVAVGDNTMSFSKLDGTEIKKINDVYYNYVPLLERLVDWQGISYPVISSTKPIMSTIHPIETLAFFSREAEENATFALENATTYMYSDGKTAIIGSDRNFTAYNSFGKKRWEYTATKDIQKMIPLYPQQKVIMISRGKVELMQVAK
ncbi:MAG TPA: hypothetical protein GX707_18425 [Epulopiscium sp.]|nr:hypothetical protein [Candidatus Epulonipiscium sp.]